MNLWPNRRQWQSWSLPSKLTAIGALLGFLSFSFYLLEKSFNILEWIRKDEQIPQVRVRLQFPYERTDGSVKQNKFYPELNITNIGKITISPLTVDANMFALSRSLDVVITGVHMCFEAHGHLILEPELKPGLSVKVKMDGMKNWIDPAAYIVYVEMIRSYDRKKYTFSSLFLIDENGIKAADSSLPKAKEEKIRSAILAFSENKAVRKKLMLTSPLEGVVVPQVEPGVDLQKNKDGTITVK